LKHGHFTAFVRRPSETWYHIDDEVVTKVDPSQVTAAEAYLLFYERRQLGLVCEENELGPKNFELEAQRNFITLYQHVLAVLQKATAHGSEEDVAKQAIMFLTTFLIEKKELEDGTAWGSSLNLVERGMGQLVGLLLEAMCKPDEDEDHGFVGFTLANAAALCLAQIALTVQDEVVSHVMPFIEANLGCADRHRNDAATLAWGCILEGPSVEALQPHVVPVLEKLLLLVGTPTMGLPALVKATWAIRLITKLHMSSIPPFQWQAMLREGSVAPSGETIEEGVLLRVFKEHRSTAEGLSSGLSTCASLTDRCVPPWLELQVEREGLLCLILRVITAELGGQAGPHADQMGVLIERVTAAKALVGEAAMACAAFQVDHSMLGGHTVHSMLGGHTVHESVDGLQMEMQMGRHGTAGPIMGSRSVMSGSSQGVGKSDKDNDPHGGSDEDNDQVRGSGDGPPAQKAKTAAATPGGASSVATQPASAEPAARKACNNNDGDEIDHDDHDDVEYQRLKSPEGRSLMLSLAETLDKLGKMKGLIEIVSPEGRLLMLPLAEILDKLGKMKGLIEIVKSRKGRRNMRRLAETLSNVGRMKWKSTKEKRDMGAP